MTMDREQKLSVKKNKLLESQEKIQGKDLIFYSDL
jgi:hypothetical protein